MNKNLRTRLCVCEYCKKEFVTKINNKRFCKPLCQGKHYNRRPEIREKNRIRMKIFRKDNAEWREIHRLLQYKYLDKRKKYRQEYFKRPYVMKKMRERKRWQLENDLDFAVADRLRRSLNHALTKYSKYGKIMSSKKYGIDWESIINHLKPFPNNLKEFEIDHIIPLCKFNLTNPEEIERAFSPNNLQWLTREENRRKGGRIIKSL